MLEKIGLAPRPSLRGNNWVDDASHCQGCSSQFTFINRKHHCRRCGGIFCSSCTQQRMVLRGQGDSPVRICEPCKKLEEAARFEMRYGHKNRAAKGGSKFSSKKEGDNLDHVLANKDKIFSTQTTSSASCSNVQQTVTLVEGSDMGRNLSPDQSSNQLTEVHSTTPEDLRQQAVVEKKKYRTLKAEGKSEEALRAFKRGKELERQAESLEISIRKNRKKALSSSNFDDIQQIGDDFRASADKIKLPDQKSKEKDDLLAELKELGWSHADLRDAEKRPTTLTLEGELSSLLREVSQTSNKEKEVVSTDKSQVIAHKKRALELKRAGNLLEAKEELKRAKILERKIEEEELLGGDDDSDDELSSLIRSMDADEHDKLQSRYQSDMNFDFDNFGGISDDHVVDGNFEVTDEDMEDPGIASALKSIGWTEETEDFHGTVSSSNRESLVMEIQSLKRAALNEKRAGNTAEAMALLKKAKVLDAELESSEAVENVNLSSDKGPKLAPKSKLTIQRELIALKKKALTLRREGRLDESEEELKKAKVLEDQLDDMNKAPSAADASTGSRQTYTNPHTAPVDGNEEEVTDQDLHDPTYLSLLKNLGWEDEDNVEVKCTELNGSQEVVSIMKDEFVVPSNNTSISSIAQTSEALRSRKSKSEIQRELLSLKRKALTLRRQGETDAADELLKNARSLEAQLQEYEEPTERVVSSENDRLNVSNDARVFSSENERVNLSADALQHAESFLQPELNENIIGDSKVKIRLEKPVEIVREDQNHDSNPSQVTVLSSLQEDILVRKKKAVTLKREGKLAEAKEELRLAKRLEKQAEEDLSQNRTNSSDSSVADVSSIGRKEASPSSVSKPLSSRDRFKLQQESLGHKRQALKLRREGKTAEAEAEFELAKALEAQLQEMDSHESAGSSRSVAPDDVSVEDFLDPQLLSALRSIGLDDVQSRSPNVETLESTKPETDDTENATEERELLAERIKAEKVKAVNLKRLGKQAEALDALRRAKLYEKKLQSLTSK